MPETFVPPRRALAVMAHPDDIEFMAGGLVSRWARAGTELHYCLLTDGNSGSRDPSLTPAALATIRRAEQQAAGAIFGVSSYAFLGHTDGRLVASIELRLAIAREIRRVRPDAVLTCDPRFFYGPSYINHPDHRAAAEATLAAVMPIANTRLAALELLAEGLEPHDVAEVYMAIPDSATLWVPLEKQDLDRKIDAMRAHASQLGGWDAAAMIRQFAEGTAQQARANGVECALAEAYVRVVLRQPPPAD
ncbi:MAG TPA: PIG-L family deacetylase [Kouleothrix sp.]|uniref:PIG-L deacetylase family protein n=1 Tax=Kouleothrix sp. TaxID=2779161 RepID=UPI002BE69E7B|nr:PIG-L family deacetylase [Kouleothrix sp.]HRC75064.1 PIG-L family deacetylase [Kouleothrix sp.]